MQDLFKSIISDQIVKQISAAQKIENTTKTKSLIEQAVPVLLSAMKNNTQTEAGKKSLETALEQKHNGSIFNQISTLANNPENSDGSAILNHLLGGKQKHIFKALAAQAGIKSTQAEKIFEIAAPLVMGAVGQAKTKEVDMKSIIKEGLKNFTNTNSKTNPLLLLLDKDGDGDIKDDLITLGIKHLKKLFKKQ